MKNNESVHSGGHLKKYMQHTPWYLLSSLTTKAMGFLLIPLLTYYLSPEEYGTLSTVESLGRLLPIFMALYLDSAFNRYYYKEKEFSNERVATLYSTHFWFIVPWGILVGVIVILLSPILLNDLTNVTTLPIIFLVVTQLLNQLAVMVTMIWNANLLAKKLALFQMIMSLLAVFFTWYMLVISEAGWESRLYALGLVSAIQLLILLYIAINNSWLVLDFDFEILKRSLKYSIPLLPNVAAGWIALFSDRLILAHFGLVDQVGLYSIAAQVAILMYVFNDAITKVQTPVAISGLTSDKDQAKRKMVSFLTGYITFMSILYFLLSLFSRELLFYFTEEAFHSAYLIVVMLGLAYFCGGVYRVFTNIISFHGATWNISIAAFIQAGVNIILNLIFIPKYGMYAAGISTVTSTMVYTLWIFYKSQQLDRLEIEYLAIFKIIALLSFSVTIGLVFDHNIAVGTELFIYKVLLFLLFFLFICRLNSSERLRELMRTLFVWLVNKYKTSVKAH